MKPSTGEHAPFFTGLRTVVDVLPFGGQSDGFFVLEFSRDLLAGLPGERALLRLADRRPGDVCGGPGHAGQHGAESRTGDLLISQLALGRVIAPLAADVSPRAAPPSRGRA